MTESVLQERFRKFAIEVYQFTRLFPKDNVYFRIVDQLTRSSSSAAANYRAACRGKSLADIINKLCIVKEETDESIFWLEYIIGVDEKWISYTGLLLKEGNELLSIIVAFIKTAKRNNIKSRKRY